MKRLLSIFLGATLIMTTLTTPIYANDFTGSEIIKEEMIVVDTNETEVNNLTSSLRGTKLPSTSSTWDIYLQKYVANLNFDTALYTNYNFQSHGGEIKVTANLSSTNPKKIKMELYEAGKSTCLTTLELNASGTTNGRFYNLDTTKNYYFKFVSPDAYKVTGEVTLYK